MKRLKYILIVAALILTISLAGCTKTWLTLFTEYTNLDSWLKQDWFAPYTVTLHNDGMYLDGKLLIGPYGFGGDFTSTFVFSLNCGAGNEITMVEFILSDGNTAPVSNYIDLYFGYVGDASLEYYTIRKTGSITLASGDEIPSINRTSLNILSVSKKGSNLKVMLNGTTLYNDDMGAFSLTHVFPYLNVDAENADQIRINSVAFRYDGDRIPRP